MPFSRFSVGPASARTAAAGRNDVRVRALLDAGDQPPKYHHHHHDQGQQHAGACGISNKTAPSSPAARRSRLVTIEITVTRMPKLSTR